MINQDKALVEEIKQQLRDNIRDYGKPYCPCVPSYCYSNSEHKDYICPCKNYREEIKVGEECHCGLYIKE